MGNRLNFFDKLAMYGFFIANMDNPRALADYYHANKQRVRLLKEVYPDWERYVAQYPELTKELRELGVPL
ncbi:MAG: hypothetical protein PHI24_13910 [Desulfitobacteriaceae bacterium]|nr:hypothetical protein [Desulfitobacteriaceae bacterium]